MKNLKASLNNKHKKILRRDSDCSFTLLTYFASFIFMLFAAIYCVGPATPSFETELTTLKDVLSGYDEPRFLFSLKYNEGYLYAIGGFILGLLSMSFLHKKAKLYTLLSQSVSRKEIFHNRAVILMIASYVYIFAVKSVSLYLNIDAFGFSWEILDSFIPHLIVCISVFTFAYVVGVGSTLFNGKLFYAFEFGVSATFVFTAFKNIIITAQENFVNGRIISDELFTDNVLNNIDPVKGYTLYETTTNSIETVSQFTEPAFISAAIWLAVSLAALRFLLKFFINSYKPEICGFAASDYKIIFAYDFLVTVIITGLVTITDEIGFQLLPGKYIAYLFVFSIIFCLVFNPLGTLITTHSFKKAGISFTGTLCSATLIGLTSLFFATNMFGIGNKLPEKSEIESVQISSPIDNLGNNLAKLSDIGIMLSYSSNNMITLTTPEDIEFALEFNDVLHKHPEEETSAIIYIMYTLKNGEKNQIKTYEGISYEATEKAKELWLTDGAKQELKNVFTPEDVYLTKDGKKPVLKTEKITITSVYNEETSVNRKISPEESEKLRRAILKDTVCKTIEERYYPTSRYLGSINFELSSSQDLFKDNEKESALLFCNSRIYENMENTISVLKDMGLYDLLTKDRTITKAYVTDYHNLKAQTVASLPLIYDENTSVATFNNCKIDITESVEHTLTWKSISAKEAKKLIKSSQGFYLIGKNNAKAVIVVYKTNESDKQEQPDQKPFYNIYLIP